MRTATNDDSIGASEQPAVRMSTAALLSTALILVSFGLLYRDVIVKLVHDWATDDNYSHGFLIVPLSLFLVWERRSELLALTRQPTYLGLLIIIASVAVLAAGTLGAELFLARISMIGVVIGAILYLFGWQYLRVLAFPVGLLLLMVPLPALIFNQIAFPLQLLASRAGEYGLSSLNIPVLREGNVIVLAHTKLEVVEACSGIRSLVSLLTLGIVYGYFSDPRPLVRVILALGTIPIAIIANGLRITGTGVAAQYYGPEAAEGFFHTFSGWLVFMVAFVAVLALKHLVVFTIDLAKRLTGGADVHGGVRAAPRAEAPRGVQDRPHEAVGDMSWFATTTGRTVALSLCLILSAGALAHASTSELVPLRAPLSQLPLTFDQFDGARAPDLEPEVLAVLGVDDYINRVYRPREASIPVGLYIGYYMSQRQGDTMHSPMNCLPGSGWQPVRGGRMTVNMGGQPREVNRYIIEKGGDHLLVLYWYQSHGRVVASEYWGRIYMVLDAMRMNRTDAALVRIVVPIPYDDASGEDSAEQLALGFSRAMFPLLDRHLPV